MSILNDFRLTDRCHSHSGIFFFRALNFKRPFPDATGCLLVRMRKTIVASNTCCRH